mgnify:CR=1 FL=1
MKQPLLPILLDAVNQVMQKGASQGNGSRAGRGEDGLFIVVIVVFPILPLPVALGEAFVPLVPYTVFI